MSSIKKILIVSWKSINQNVIDKNFIESESCNIVIQINGKKKGTIKVDENTKKDRVIETIIGSQNNYSINLKKAKKIIFVSNKIINFVI